MLKNMAQMLNKGLPGTTQATPLPPLLPPKENRWYCLLQTMLPPQAPERAQPLTLRSQTLHTSSPLLRLELTAVASPTMASMSSLPPRHWLCIHPTLHLTRPLLIYRAPWFFWMPVLNLLGTHLTQGPLHLFPQRCNVTSFHRPYHQLGLPYSS